MDVGEVERWVRALAVPTDGDDVVRLLRLRDAVDALLSAAVGHFAASEQWAIQGATSVKAWLRHEGRLPAGDAHRLARTATRLHGCPATQRAWLDGDLSSGHVQAVVANVSDATAAMYADHEADVVPVLAGLPAADASTFMREWRLHADALIDDPEPTNQPARSLYHSRTLDSRSVLQGGFDAEGAEVIDTALRLAMATDSHDESNQGGQAGDGDHEAGVGDDVAGGRVRLPAERRADALVDVCRHFLDHQQAHRGGRHRPHLNVIVDLDAIQHRVEGQSPGHGRLVDGTPLDPVTTQRLLCDAAIHRVVTNGRSTVLDYGRTTRTIPAPLWTALVLRDRHCRAPGCDRHPDMCEAHHVIPVRHEAPCVPGAGARPVPMGCRSSPSKLRAA